MYDTLLIGRYSLENQHKFLFQASSSGDRTDFPIESEIQERNQSDFNTAEVLEISVKKIENAAETRKGCNDVAKMLEVPFGTKEVFKAKTRG